MASPKIQNLAQRLLILEAAQDINPDAADEVAVRVIERLRERLVRLAGMDGFRSLLSRALTLAKVDSPALSPLRVSSNGSLEGFDEMDCSQTAAEQAKVVLVAHLLALLVTFIGESLTLHLVRDAWPDASIERAETETTETEDKP